MRFLALIALLSAGCGSDDKDSSAPAAQSDVIRVAVEKVSASELTGASVNVTAEYSGSSVTNDPDLRLVVSYAEGGTAPVQCDGTSKIAAINYIFIDGLKLDTTYAFRVCTFRPSTNSYSAGQAATFKTPAK